MSDRVPQDGVDQVPLNALGQVESPCRSICKLNSASVCEGCFRTSSEISFWVTMSNEERLQVLLNARKRANEH